MNIVDKARRGVGGTLDARRNIFTRQFPQLRKILATVKQFVVGSKTVFVFLIETQAYFSAYLVEENRIRS